MKKYFFLLLIISLFYSCKEENKLKVDVSNISIKFNVFRFEEVFYNAKPADLPKIKKDYSILFPHDNDSIWIAKMLDKDEQNLFKMSQKVFGNFSKQKKEIKTVFKHVKYYFKKFKEPEVITLLSDISVNQRVVLDPTIMYLSIDTFLGENNEFYEGYPAYIKQNLTPKQLPVKVAYSIAEKILGKNLERTFSDKMIYYGKLNYLINAFNPDFNEFENLSFTKDQYQWIKNNQESIWRYFVDKDLLFSTDKKLNLRFIEDAPFSKFYLDIDNESPGRVAQYFGYEIVKKYMQKNNVSLQEMIKTPSDKIFKQAKYKPKKQ